VGLRVLALAGSPRRGGNTDLLLDAALAGARGAGAQVEEVRLNLLRVRPCQHCDGCIGTGVCVIDDDMQTVHRQLRAADRIILAAPIFFMALPAQAKLVIDRCQALWVEKYLLGVRRTHGDDGSRRAGLFLSVGGTRFRSLFDGARATVRAFFATCDVEYAGDLCFAGVDLAGAIKEHPTALTRAWEAGSGLVAPIRGASTPAVEEKL
jgi:putative NADPH-quinone reductase